MKREYYPALDGLYTPPEGYDRFDPDADPYPDGELENPDDDRGFETSFYGYANDGSKVVVELDGDYPNRPAKLTVGDQVVWFTPELLKELLEWAAIVGDPVVVFGQPYTPPA
jgi:hypothetical protein